ncbi:MAG: chromosome segregation protein SMC [Lachnospiraceae bacterium]|nr:chromosome segregation protein SMC [Lachnospiraceae bacterium]
MYLKQIEIQGFKSFANKMVFRFDRGITAIVGPNGSGKSNISDALRWVLGEQSAKQLRSTRMEDVIFAGTEARRPLGFAYVAITFDNSDHRLDIDYDEVTVARRVYRSGESEYLINDSACRLRDIQELFFDTGIGKEGYSIISQGRVEKVLSEKPEERRDLLDEAAGIVKYKKRKAIALKNLETEKQNLERVSDIIRELEKQVGPLKAQSEKAREYLKLKSTLKKYDVNMFLSEYDRIHKQLETIEKNRGIAEADLKENRELYENIKKEYEELELKIAEMDAGADRLRERINGVLLEKEKTEGSIRLLNEQIRTGEENSRESTERMDALREQIRAREDMIASLQSDTEAAEMLLQELYEKRQRLESEKAEMTEGIDSLEHESDIKNTGLKDSFSEEADIKELIGRNNTLIEQIDLRRSQIAAQFVSMKESGDLDTDEIRDCENRLSDVRKKLGKCAEKEKKLTAEKDDVFEKSEQLRVKAEKAESDHRDILSRYNALKNISENYEGYGISIKHIMEERGSDRGIEGVVADLIKVDKEYETAVETALGSRLQNIVTDNESTAKVLIEFLKFNKYGRATFLPLTSIRPNPMKKSDPVLKEKGVLGRAADLVKCSDKYETLKEYLLGGVVVCDDMEHALAIERKHNFDIRIVTLDGESFARGGSISGGRYKNNAGFLGRGRELEALKKRSDEALAAYRKIRESSLELAEKDRDIRLSLEELQKETGGLRIEENTALMELDRIRVRKEEKYGVYEELKKEDSGLEERRQEILKETEDVEKKLQSILSIRTDIDKELTEITEKAHDAREKHQSIMESDTELAGKITELEQRIRFSGENISRISDEISTDKDNIAAIEKSREAYEEEKARREQELKDRHDELEKLGADEDALREELKTASAEKEMITADHREFFNRRDEAGSIIAELDKELYRLNSQKERFSEQIEELTAYIWDEYELTYTKALEEGDEQLLSMSNQTLKRNTNAIKADIRALGDVNVNAIEQYKEVSERYEVLHTQQIDLLESEKKLNDIIGTLNKAMAERFSVKFREIREEFDKVFSELFSGGHANLELVDSEDLLNTGILVEASPPGKKLQNLMQMSGGEKALTAIALLFAIQRLNPSPFCLHDEIESALDDENVERYANYVRSLSKDTQFIVITHRKASMNAADTLYGITMQEKGVSAMVSVSLIDAGLE